MFHSFLLLSIFSLLSLTTTSPTATLPFQGQGKLIALQNGNVIGCLTPLWQLSVSPDSCGCFNSTYITEVIDFGGPQTTHWYQIGSSAGICGYTYHPSNSGVENAQFLLGCGGNVTRQTEQYVRAGRYSMAGWTVLMVQINANFTTPDTILPIGTEVKDVLTDPTMYKTTDFQIGWTIGCDKY